MFQSQKYPILNNSPIKLSYGNNHHGLTLLHKRLKMSWIAKYVSLHNPWQQCHTTALTKHTVVPLLRESVEDFLLRPEVIAMALGVPVLCPGTP